MSLSLANPVNEPQFAQSAPLFGHWDRLHDLIRSLWPVKTSAHLAHAAGLSQRAAELSLSERRQFAPESLISLLDTEHGPEVLIALTAHSDQEWTKAFQKWWTLQKLKAAHAEMQKQIDELSK